MGVSWVLEEVVEVLARVVASAPNWTLEHDIWSSDRGLKVCMMLRRKRKASLHVSNLQKVELGYHLHNLSVVALASPKSSAV